jgi:hypothetical protein
VQRADPARRLHRRVSRDRAPQRRAAARAHAQEEHRGTADHELGARRRVSPVLLKVRAQSEHRRADLRLCSVHALQLQAEPPVLLAYAITCNRAQFNSSFFFVLHAWRRSWRACETRPVKPSQLRSVPPGKAAPVRVKDD